VRVGYRNYVCPICLSRPHTNSGPDSPWGHRYISAISSSSMRSVADRHRLAAIIVSTAVKRFRGTNSDYLEPPEIGVFSEFFTISGCDAHSQSELHQNHWEGQDNLHTKFSALNRFRQHTFWPLGSRSPPYEGIKFGYPLQNARFPLLSTYLAWERLQIGTDFRLIITSSQALLPSCPVVPTSMTLKSKIAGF